MAISWSLGTVSEHPPTIDMMNYPVKKGRSQNRPFSYYKATCQAEILMVRLVHTAHITHAARGHGRHLFLLLRLVSH